MSEDLNLIQASLGVEGTTEAPETTQETVETTQAAPAQQQAPAVNLDDVIKEKTGGKFEKFEDFLKINETPAVEFKNETSKQVYEYLKEGKISEASEILEKQRLVSSVDSMSAEDAIKLKLQMENPEWTLEDINDEYKSKYVREADLDMMNDEEKAAHEKEIKRIERELKKEAKAAKEYLSGLKQEIAIPDITVADEKSIVDKYLLSEQTKVDALRQEFLQSVDNGVDSIEDFAIEYKDDEIQFNGKFSMTAEDKQALKQSMKNLEENGFINGSRYFKDGKYDTKQMARDNYVLDNFDKIVQSLVTQAVSKTKADFIKNVKGIDFSEGPRQNYKPDKEQAYKELSDFMLSL